MNLSKITQQDVYGAALDYAQAGLSIIPVDGKKPAIGRWQQYQARAADEDTIVDWSIFGAFGAGGLAIITGRVSGLMIVDLDGLESIQAYDHQFPTLTETYAVKSGSGKGRHYYYIPCDPSDRFKTNRSVGFELRGDGCYVVAPPSRHPSGGRYEALNDLPVMRADLTLVREWIAAKARAQYAADKRMNMPAPVAPSGGGASHFPEFYVRAYVRGAIRKACQYVEYAHAGNRNNALFAASVNLGRLAASHHVQHYGALNTSEIEILLTAAAQSLVTEDGLKAVSSTIRSGIQRGLGLPYEIPQPRQR